jgi:type I restriction enzyme S subunit
MDRGSLHVDLEDKKFVNLPIDSIEGTRTKVCEGDILISITADLGIVSFIDKYFPFEGYVSQHIALCRANVEKVTPKYLAYLLASPYGQKKLASLNDGGAKAGISLKNLQKLKLSIHSQCEQLEIVKTLECIDKQNKLLDKSLIKTRSMFNVIVDASL